MSKMLNYDFHFKYFTQTLISQFVFHQSVTHNYLILIPRIPALYDAYVDNFIRQSEINIEKLVALRDIDYSNSMVEAVNKIAKYQYLFPKHPENLEELLEQLAFFVEDYNEVRPHG